MLLGWSVICLAEKSVVIERGKKICENGESQRGEPAQNREKLTMSVIPEDTTTPIPARMVRNSLQKLHE